MSTPLLRCPKCGASNFERQPVCARCKACLLPPDPSTATEPLPAAPPSPEPPADTILWQAKGLQRQRLPVDVFVSRSGKPHCAVAVADLFGFKRQLVMGRATTCDVCLPHPSVSRRHAVLELLASGGLRVRDLDSVNGVRVNGRRIFEPYLLKEQERLGIGPYLFTLSGGQLHALDSSQSLRLEARQLEKVVPVVGGQTRKLLDNVNLVVEPGEFVSLLGPSGSGKSTLMDCLNGRRPATGGRVLANGEDFYLHFDSFRQSLGYVPQKDIVHSQLPVYKALYYTARLRLPTDTEPNELRARIDEVVRLMELGPHQYTLVGNLSGGQIKRVSLGAELLARPCLLYIDEATSGLDAGTEARMMRLFRSLADEGKSVLCITHNVDNVDLCHLVAVLCQGRLVYYGPPKEALAFFHVPRISAVYDQLAERTAAEWERQFRESSLHQQYVASRLQTIPHESVLLRVAEGGTWERIRDALLRPKPAGSDSDGAHPARTSGITHPFAAAQPPSGPQQERPHKQFFHQFWVLTCRYIELIWRDARTLRLLLLQAPIVALFILLGFLNKPYQEEVLVPRKLTDDERESLQLALEQYRRYGDAADASRPLLSFLALDSKKSDKARKLLEQLPMTAEQAEVVLRAKGPVVPDQMIINPRFTYMLLFLMVITILWFGCNNAAREIIKEQPIYARERAVNLNIGPYLASKFLVLSGISAVQVFLVMACIYGVLEVCQQAFGWEKPPAVYRIDYLPQFGVLLLLAMSGVGLGLLLSACVSSPDRATTLLPYVLIPQIILGGGFLQIREEPLRSIAYIFAPAYWGFRGIRAGETDFPPDFPVVMDYNDSLWIVCLALASQTMVLLGLTAWFLKRQETRKA